MTFNPWRSWSTFVGIFYPAFHELDTMVAAAASNQSCGLFIVPIWPEEGRTVSFASEEPTTWYRLLKRHALLTFAIESPVFAGAGPSQPPSALQHGICGIVASFNWYGKLKSKRRPENYFALSHLPYPSDTGQSKINVVAFCPTRVSPLAHNMRPTRAADTCKATTPISALGGHVA